MNLHPIVVQFAIALLMASVLFDLLGVLFPRSNLHQGAVLLLFIGVASSLGSGFSGDLAVQRLPIAEQSLPAVTAHRDFGATTVWLAVLLLLFRMYLAATRRFVRILRGLYLLLGIVVVALLSITGYSGGNLVFVHGIGVKQTLASPPHH